MIVIIVLGILAAAVIGVTADSLGSRAHLAEAAELTDSAPSPQGASS
jgi:type II secretory pathway pseudopilin PulG